MFNVYVLGKYFDDGIKSFKFGWDILKEEYRSFIDFCYFNKLCILYNVFFWK